MAVSVQKACGSLRGKRKNPNSEWWNDKIKAAVERKEAAWKNVLGSKCIVKETCMEIIKKEIISVKRCK